MQKDRWVSSTHRPFLLNFERALWRGGAGGTIAHDDSVSGVQFQPALGKTLFVQSGVALAGFRGPFCIFG